jgi:hypothetical protein
VRGSRLVETTTRGFSGFLTWAFACDGPMVSLCLDDLAQFGPFSSPSEQPFTVFFFRATPFGMASYF